MRGAHWPNRGQMSVKTTITKDDDLLSEMGSHAYTDEEAGSFPGTDVSLTNYKDFPVERPGRHQPSNQVIRGLSLVRDTLSWCQLTLCEVENPASLLFLPKIQNLNIIERKQQVGSL